MINTIRITGIIILTILSQSCKKDKATPPIIATENVTEISYTTATSGGNVTNEGGATVLNKGVCWNTTADPTISNNKTVEDGGSGIFSSSLTQLTPNTLYYVRAYATNSAGTSYGNQVSFTTSRIEVPLVLTINVSSTTQTTAISGGSVIKDNGALVTSRGICWSLTTMPSIENDKTSDGTGIGDFTSIMTGLETEQTYFVRAYATNSVGTGYGTEVKITIPVFDIDGNLYHKVIIGTQSWLVENLKTTKYSNGDLIGTTSPATLNISGETNPKYQWLNGNNENRLALYGRLYTWFVIADTRNICPTGWHVPTESEWRTLINYLGGEGMAGAKLKEVGSAHWEYSSIVSTNETGFTALPGGSRYYSGIFSISNWQTYWWSSDYNTVLSGTSFFIEGNLSAIMYKEKNYGLSVRCLKN